MIGGHNSGFRLERILYCQSLNLPTRSFRAGQNPLRTVSVVVLSGRPQIPLEGDQSKLDDNGDRQSNSKDGELAREWKLNTDAVLGDDDETTIPVLAEPQTPETVNSGEGMIRVAISNNERVARVWVEVRSPNYTEPATVTDGVMPELDLPVVSLSDSDQDGIYIGVYEGFVEAGVYRFVAYAEDVDSNMLLPNSTEMEITLAELDSTSEPSVESLPKRIYLPLISR